METPPSFSPIPFQQRLQLLQEVHDAIDCLSHLEMVARCLECIGADRPLVLTALLNEPPYFQDQVYQPHDAMLEWLARAAGHAFCERYLTVDPFVRQLFVDGSTADGPAESCGTVGASFHEVVHGLASRLRIAFFSQVCRNRCIEVDGM